VRLLAGLRARGLGNTACSATGWIIVDSGAGTSINGGFDSRLTLVSPQLGQIAAAPFAQAKDRRQ